MPKITVSEDCGNSPKTTLLRDLNIAFVKDDVEFIVENVTDDIEWNIIGKRQIREKSNVAETVEQMKDERTTELTINHVITHGATASVDGFLKLDSGKSYAFSTVYEFSSHAKNAKIKNMTSYVIETDM